MGAGKLSPLQVRILRTLAGLETRDLDLFWQARRSLDDAPENAKACLESAGLQVAVLQRVEAFARLEVRAGEDVTVVDLVADPVPLAESPVETDVDGARILVDTPHQIFVNKLCALLSRSELRDLEDVHVLISAGLDLKRGLADAPAQDGGFSPLTFAWVLRELPIASLATALGRTCETIRELELFRDGLVERVLAMAMPE